MKLIFALIVLIAVLVCLPGCDPEHPSGATSNRIYRDGPMGPYPTFPVPPSQPLPGRRR